MIANARMYAIDATTAAAWRVLLEWVGRRSGVPFEVIDYPAPQPLSELWNRADLGCAFMCGYPFATTKPRPTLLAAPVPSPAPYGGRPVYWTDFVTAISTRIDHLDDVLGKRMAWTTEESQSGFHAPRGVLAPYAQRHDGSLFTASVGPL